MATRGEVMQSREPCSVHPEPTYPPGTFLPRVESDLPISTLPDPASAPAPDQPHQPHATREQDAVTRRSEAR